ncbi:MAG: hypothetical protein ACRDI2_18580, partial [Chloroflexota bacterium]
LRGGDGYLQRGVNEGNTQAQQGQKVAWQRWRVPPAPERTHELSHWPGGAFEQPRASQVIRRKPEQDCTGNSARDERQAM